MSIFSNLLFRYSLFPRQNLLRFSSNNGFNPDEFEEEELAPLQDSLGTSEYSVPDSRFSNSTSEDENIDPHMEIKLPEIQMDIDPRAFVPDDVINGRRQILRKTLWDI